MRKLLIFFWLLAYLFAIFCIFVSFYFGGTAALFEYFSLIPQSSYVLIFLVLLVSGYSLFGQRAPFLLLLPVSGLLMSVIWLLDIVWIRIPEHVHEFTGETVRVVNWNTEVWDVHREPMFIREMKLHTADVYLLQEVLNTRSPGVAERMQRAFPEYSVEHHGEFMVLSRFPISHSEYPLSQGYSRHEIQIQDKMVTFYNIHWRVPIFGDRVRRDNGYDFAMRSTQFHDLTRDLYTTPGPVFMGGDFNSTRNYSFIRFLEQQYTMNQPNGVLIFPKTYHTSFPAIRIDYQFTNKTNTFVRYTRFGGTISDHFGIYGEFRLQ